MRAAMAEAEVGDDVYGDDPTVRGLEKLGAELTGKEAALFVPSGTFGNQLALFTWCKRGTEVLLGEESHIIQHEAGAASIIAGVQTRPLAAPDGILSVPALAARLRRRDLHYPATSLICLENAHSLGRAVPLDDMDAVQALAGEWDLPIHLDGARIFNAALTLGCSAEDIARRVSSVMLCLSKGLCAPVGSLLAGPAGFIEEARYRRKILGGGMRQAGILAAAGILALKEQPVFLADDHHRARKLEEALGEIPGIEIIPGDINMVFFRWNAVEDTAWAAAVTEAFRQQRILINPPEGKLFRFVTHHWIGDAELGAVIKAARAVFGGDSAEAFR
jgi:threonine aldolase